MTALGAMAAWAARAQENSTKAARRRGYAIHAYVGANGGGKTLAAVHDTIPSLLEGRPVLSTVRILAFDDEMACGSCEWFSQEEHESGLFSHRKVHPGVVRFHDWGQLLEWRDGDVIMDEIVGVASSRESMSMPVQAMNFLMQLRRREVLLRWTAPAWARADKSIREVTQAVTACKGSMPQERRAGDNRLWRDRRFFHWATYDAFEFDEFTTYKRDTMKPLIEQYFWRPGSLAGRAYDTFEPVAALSEGNESGTCIRCGGRRPRKACSCRD